MFGLRFIRQRGAPSVVLLLGLVAIGAYLQIRKARAPPRATAGSRKAAAATPASTDCLFILQAAIGVQTCNPECICDVVGRDGVSASDALVCLQTVVGSGFPFDCPCDDTTTTTVPGSLAVTATVEGDALPGATLSASADIVLPPGCALASVAWTQTSGAPATIVPTDSAETSIVLPSASDYKGQLIERLEEPPITADQLPPNVPLPEGEFPGGLPDRFQIVGVNPFALEAAERLRLRGHGRDVLRYRFRHGRGRDRAHLCHRHRDYGTFRSAGQ